MRSTRLLYRQIGFLIIVLFAFVEIVTIVFFYKNLEKASLLTTTLYSSIIPIVFILLFYKMDIIVNEEEILVLFGIGLFKKRVSLKEITSVYPVTNPALVGLGIRFTLDYDVYNISGNQAIEIALKGKSRTIRIGTNSPFELSRTINALLNKKM